MAYLKQGADYFPHDTNARMDTKMKILTAFYGIKGYGVYFSLLEDIYKQKDYQLQIDDNYRMMFTSDNKIDIREFDDIIGKCLEVGLFDQKTYNKTKKLTSSGIKKRVETLEEYRRKERERKARSRDKNASNVPRDTGGTNTGQVTETKETQNGQGADCVRTTDEYSREEYSKSRVETEYSNLDIESKKVSNARADEKKPESFDEIIDKNCKPIVANAFRSFLKHCGFHQKLPTNEKLYDMIVRLDLAYGTNEQAKVDSIQQAISGGYYDIREKFGG